MIGAKRAFDLAFCCLAAPVVAPLAACIAVAVRISSGPPVLFRSQRAGLGGTSFAILKFRTMATAGQGARVTAAGDARVTPIGRWLRRTKLDELPQLVNVLRGDMAIVGPRPEDPVYVAQHAKDYELILTVRPGLTGPAALAFRDEEVALQYQVELTGDDLESVYVRDLLPQKIALDLDYVHHHGLRSDLAVIAATARAVLVRSRREVHTTSDGAQPWV